MATASAEPTSQSRPATLPVMDAPASKERVRGPRSQPQSTKTTAATTTALAVSRTSNIPKVDTGFGTATTNGNASNGSNGYANGYTNGYTNGKPFEFLAKENTQPAQSEADHDSFAELSTQVSQSTATSVLVEGDDRYLRDIDRAPPGDPHLRRRKKSLLALRNHHNNDDDVAANGSTHDLNRKRSQYFEDVFSARDGNASPAKERVRSESLVLAEVRTNVIVADEFTIITELSAHLALRYRRPLQSIIVTLQHNSCMCFGGSFDPAYVMTVSALPSELQPTTNKRNAALIQKHMEEALGVPASRGFLRFAPVPEANLAYGGNTASGHVDDMARQYVVASGSGSGNGRGSTEDPYSRAPAGSAAAAEALHPSNSRKQKASRKRSVMSLSSLRSPSATELSVIDAPAEDKPPPRQPTPLAAIPERSSKGSPRDAHPTREKGTPEKALRAAKNEVVEEEIVRPKSVAAMGRQSSQRARRTKSFVATLFGRS